MEIKHYKLKFHKEIKRSRRNPNYTKKKNKQEGRNLETQTKRRRNSNKKHEETTNHEEGTN